MSTPQNDGIVSAIEVFDGMERLADALAVSREAVRRWRNGVDKVPAERCVQIEAVTKGRVRCEQLRPDVAWGVLRGSARAIA